MGIFMHHPEKFHWVVIWVQMAEPSVKHVLLLLIKEGNKSNKIYSKSQDLDDKRSSIHKLQYM